MLIVLHDFSSETLLANSPNVSLHPWRQRSIGLIAVLWYIVPHNH